MARLGQIIKKLNIGISTATEFLNKKGETIEANPNLKLSEVQESLLIKEFSSDKDLKLESERISQQRLEKEKQTEVAIEGYETTPEPQEIKIEIEQPQIKQVGTIDLNNLQPKKSDKAEKPEKVETEVVEEQLKKEEKVPSATKKKSPQTKAEKKSAEQPMKELVKQSETPTEVLAEATEVEKEDNVFVYRKLELESNIKVVDKIDLSAINHATRPVKKSKEEKRKERMEKEIQDRVKIKKQKPSDDLSFDDNKHAATSGSKSSRKKRKRIGGSERIDVAQNTYSDTKSPRTKFNKRPVKGNVISEEDVAKQIKETLARLTEGKKSGKRAARYRKDKREANVQRMQDLEAQELQEFKNIETDGVCYGKRTSDNDEYTGYGCY